MISSNFCRSNAGRSRRVYAGLALLTLVSGLATRPLRLVVAPELVENIGDVLWAVLVYLLIAFVWRRQTSGRIGLVALTISIAVETSQLCHVAWLDALRRTTLGGLVLGWGFAWGDLVAYAVGISACVLLERYFARKQNTADSRKG